MSVHAVTTATHVSPPMPNVLHSLAAALVLAGVGREGGTESDCPSAAKGQGHRHKSYKSTFKGPEWSGMSPMASLAISLRAGEGNCPPLDAMKSTARQQSAEQGL